MHTPARSFPPFAALLLAACLAAPVHADQLRLVNGDRITGTVVAKFDDVVVIRTPYAGEVRIKWAQVSGLEVDTPVKVMLKGGRPEPAVIDMGEPGQARIVRGSERRAVRLADIAYINPQPDQAGTGIAYSGHVTVAANFHRGNTDGNQVHADLALTGRARDYRFNVAGKVNRVRDDGVGLTANNWLLNGSYDRFISRRHFLYARSSFEHDPFKDLVLRSTVGAGYGRQLLEQANVHLSLQGGLDLVDVDNDVAADDRYPAFGWGVHYDQWLLGRSFQAFHDQEGYLNLSNLSSVVVRSKTGLRVPLYTGLDATAQLNLDWDSAPPADKKAVDSALLFGVGYKW
jgi:putative salt-induced outer membrane protein YdiY